MCVFNPIWVFMWVILMISTYLIVTCLVSDLCVLAIFVWLLIYMIPV